MLLTELIDMAHSGGRIHRWDWEITPRHFPDEDIRDGLELVSLEQLGLTEEDYYLTAQIRKAMDSLGWFPAVMIELVDYASRGWDMTTAVAALGYPWISEENLEAAKIQQDYIPVEFVGTLQFAKRHNQRWLTLESAPTKPWTDKFRFLATRVRPNF